MNSIVISDNKETIIGFRLAGIRGKLVDSNDDILKIVDDLILDNKIGIIMITQKFFSKYQSQLLKRKLDEDETLIVEIPGFGEKPRKNLISDNIRDAIGLKL